VAAFEQLGPKASAAIPIIIPLLNDPDSAGAALVALISLQMQSERDILCLTNALLLRTGGHVGLPVNQFYGTAILALSTFGSKASNAIPLLLETLQSTNEYVQGASAVALARIGASRDRLVSGVLTNLKTNVPPMTAQPSLAATTAFMGRVYCLQMSLWALGQCGRKATRALPILSNFLSFPEETVEVTARNAANKIRADTRLPEP